MKTILALIFSFVFVGCFFYDTTVNPGEEFILKKGETAKIKTTALQVKMLGNGQAQREEGGDVPFCKFEVKSKNKTEELTINVGKTMRFESFTIKLQAVDTTTDSKAEDPWSNTTCKFVVTKNK